MDDKNLITLLKESPQEGLARAIDLYAGSVKWIAQKILGADKRQDVEECVSDTFVKLWQGIYRFEPESGVPLKSYIFGIARHIAITRRRKTQKTEILPLEEDDMGIDMDFVSEMARKENVKILQNAVDGLPPPDREIFIRRYYFEEGISEIADKLSLTPKAVENKLYRGKKALKDRLLERGIIL